MRLLIAAYLAFGAGYLVLSAWIFALVVGHPRRREEGLMVAGILALTACIPLLAAYGLWRRWRMVRLLLLVISAWCILASVGTVAMVLTSQTGLIDGQELGFHEEVGETLAIVLGISAFAAWQAWILFRPSVRESFLPKKQKEPLL